MVKENDEKKKSTNKIKPIEKSKAVFILISDDYSYDYI